MNRQEKILAKISSYFPMSISDACIVAVTSQTNLNEVFLRDINGSSTFTIHDECITQIMAENLSAPHNLLTE